MKPLCCVILLFHNDTVLLQLRDEHAPTHPNKWAFFGGGVDEGEDVTETIIREAQEELGYTLVDPELFLIRKQVHPYFDTEHIFIAEYDGQELTLGEGADMGWFRMDEVRELSMVEDKKIILQLAFEYRQQRSMD